MSAIRALRMVSRRPAMLRPSISAIRPQRAYASLDIEAIKAGKMPEEDHSHDLPHVPEPTVASNSGEVPENLTTDDPLMNGNYPDPNVTSGLPVKRQFRDPYADWWDKQERRNYGETVHEDNDILGIFSPEEYTHVTPAWGGVQWLCFLGATGLVLGTVYQYYPDKVSAPRAFPGGLERELGGPGAVPARKTSEDESIL